MNDTHINKGKGIQKGRQRMIEENEEKVREAIRLLQSVVITGDGNEYERAYIRGAIEQLQDVVLPNDD